MADFDLGYFYWEHDKNEEARELESSGSSYISTGITLVVFSFIISVIFRQANFLVIAGLGFVMISLGIYKHSKVAVEKVQKYPQQGQYFVELHHQDAPPHKVVSSPSIIREHIKTKFSDEVAKYHAEKMKIAGIIQKSSGSDINQIFQSYKKTGGIMDHIHFVKAVHALQRHGAVKIRKALSQASSIPQAKST